MLSSCTPLHKLRYIQDSGEQESTDKNTVSSAPIYKIQKGDNLYVNIVSSTPEMNAIFSVNDTKLTTNAQPSNLYINSMKVNDSGYIELPLLGKFFVQNKIIEQVRQDIQAKSRTLTSDAVVTVKLVNFSITILGEVLRPGLYYVNDDKITIFEAIGLASDLTVYGNRKKISIMRKKED